MSAIIPAIKYENCSKAIDWLCDVFGLRVDFCVQGEGDRIEHAQLLLDESMIMVGSTDRSEFGVLNTCPHHIEGRVTSSLYVVVTDVAGHYEAATRLGAEVVIDLKMEDYGGASYTCRDIEGHIWTFGTYDPFA
jgi:uncharacterized glyoxalase superfamily protein PhnB